MPPQDIRGRVKRLVSDFTKKPSTDLRKRWAKIVEDNPDGLQSVISELGHMPEATLDDIPIETAVNYAARDADATYRVHGTLSSQLDREGLRPIYDLDMSVVPMVDRMQMVGIRIDREHFSYLAEYLTDLMEIKQKEIVDECRARPSGIGTITTIEDDFNPNSPKQCAELLFGQSGLRLKPPKQTRGGLDSTDDKVLESLRFTDSRVGLICDFRELSKLYSSFAVVLPLAADKDDRIHPRTKITRVSSGRFAMADPNLLAIPVRSELGKLIRAGFIAPARRQLGGWDLDQIEMREMAHQSNDPRMVAIFRDGKIDIHRQTAAWSFGIKPEDVTVIQRYAAKRIGFGVITGITEIGLAWQMALAGAVGWDEGRCKDAIAEYFKIYTGVKGYMEACRAEARRFSYVTDRWGRRRYLPGVHSDLHWIAEEALRQSHSFKISSSAQGTLKHAMAAIWDWWKADRILGRVEPLLQIHDELIVELDDDPEFAELIDNGIVHFMTNIDVIQMRVPIKAKGSVAKDWGSLKD